MIRHLGQRLFLCENFGSLDGPIKVIRTKICSNFQTKVSEPFRRSGMKKRGGESEDRFFAEMHRKKDF